MRKDNPQRDWIDIERLGGARLLALYALLIHIVLQSVFGFIGSASIMPSDADGFAARFGSAFCLPGGSADNPDQNKPGSGQNCQVCHIHCSSLIALLGGVVLAYWLTRQRAPRQILPTASPRAADVDRIRRCRGPPLK